MGLMDLCKEEKIHTRDIKVEVYPISDGSIIVRGELKDMRLSEITGMFGDKVPAGIVHNLFLTLKVDRPGFLISDIEVEMRGVPKEGCREAEKTLQWLKGKRIAQGFTTMVKERTGRGAGCTHLSSLLLAMAPMAIQGFYTSVSRKKRSKEEILFALKNFLKNTCLVWKEDGEYYRKALEDAKKLKF